MNTYYDDGNYEFRYRVRWGWKGNRCARSFASSEEAQAFHRRKLFECDHFQGVDFVGCVETMEVGE